MLELLLNYATLTIAAVLFLGLVALLLFKRNQMSKPHKRIIYLLCAILVIYLVFIAILTLASGNTHPQGSPSPVWRK